jgi:hypothetical protein
MPVRVRLSEGLGHTGDHEVKVVAALNLTKPAALVHVLRRIVWVNRERHLPITSLRGSRKRLKHQLPTVALVLELRLERDA